MKLYSENNNYWSTSCLHAYNNYYNVCPNCVHIHNIKTCAIIYHGKKVSKLIVYFYTVLDNIIVFGILDSNTALVTTTVTSLKRVKWAGTPQLAAQY